MFLYSVGLSTPYSNGSVEIELGVVANDFSEAEQKTKQQYPKSTIYAIKAETFHHIDEFIL